MVSLPRWCVYRGRKCRVLYYAGDNRWRILLPDDTQTTVSTARLRIIG